MKEKKKDETKKFLNNQLQDGRKEKEKKEKE